MTIVSSWMGNKNNNKKVAAFVRIYVNRIDNDREWASIFIDEFWWKNSVLCSSFSNRFRSIELCAGMRCSFPLFMGKESVKWFSRKLANRMNGIQWMQAEKRAFALIIQTGTHRRTHREVRKRERARNYIWFKCCELISLFVQNIDKIWMMMRRKLNNVELNTRTFKCMNK